MIKHVMNKVVVVGCGITGSVCASLLKSDTLQISIFEKSRGAGGRMNTSRSQQIPDCTVDIGAQYVTATEETFASNQKIYEELLNQGVLQPLQAEIEGHHNAFPNGVHNFVTPAGMNSIVKYYLKKSGAKVEYNQRLLDVSELGEKWQLTTESGLTELCDGLVLTMPVPQILQLQGTIKQIIDSKPDIREKLEKVLYSSRYAVGLFYETGTTIDVPWVAKYIQGDPCICFMAIDSKKRGPGSEVVAPSVVAHANVPFSLAHLEEDLDSVCNEHLVPRVKQLLPQLPQPTEVKNHRWRYSQVHKGYEGSPGAIILNESPLLVIAGDAFTKSGFDGCVDSAIKVQQLFKSVL